MLVKRRVWMPTSDTSEKGLEALIVNSLVEESRYLQGDSGDYDRDYGVDSRKLFAFLEATQPKTVERLGLAEDGSGRRQFLNRLQ